MTPRHVARRVHVTAVDLRDRAVCAVRGHMWDSDRPAGPIHARDICWRCPAVREHAP